MFKVVETQHEGTLGDFDYRIIVKEQAVWVKRKRSKYSWHTAPSVQIWNGVTWVSAISEGAGFANLYDYNTAINLIHDSWVQEQGAQNA